MKHKQWLRKVALEPKYSGHDMPQDVLSALLESRFIYRDGWGYLKISQAGERSLRRMQGHRPYIRGEKVSIPRSVPTAMLEKYRIRPAAWSALIAELTGEEI